MDIYHYFVSYSYKSSRELRDNGPGYFSKEVVIGDPITTYKQVQDIQEEIGDAGNSGAIVLYYQLLRVDRD